VPLPDPHADEPTIEGEGFLVDNWRQAQRNADAWQVEANRLRAKLEEIIGDAYALTIDGVKVITNRPTVRYAEARIKQDFPDLVQHFTKPTFQEKFDVGAFAAAHPDIAARYRVRSFRQVTTD
jgi:hypothetical protein